MKRFSLIVLAIAMIISLVNTGDAKAKKVVVTDQILIKKAVLTYDDARLKHKQTTKLETVKFGEIKIVSGWAKTMYNRLDSKGKEIQTGDNLTYILKKSNGKWRVKMASEQECIDVDQCKKIGLPQETAKKLGVLLWWD